MEQRTFGTLGEVSALSLGGGGTGGVWGPTSRKESVATVREAVATGITLLDVAPGYGYGEAERVIGEAFSGLLPDGVRVSTKCNLGSPAGGEALSLMEGSLDESLKRMRLEWVDLLIWHSNIFPDDATGHEGTPRALFREVVIDAFERLVSKGRIGAWGISAINMPSAVLETLEDDPAPGAAQAISNLLDSSGGEADHGLPAEGPIGPRDIVAAAHRRGSDLHGVSAVGYLRVDDDVQAPHPVGALLPLGLSQLVR